MELMIVVVVIAIIGTIAYPTYQTQAVRARHTDAKVMLLQIMQKQREFFTNNNTYTASLVTDLGYVSAGGQSISTEQGLFNVTAEQCGGDPIALCVQLKAVPQSGQAGGVTFTYNSRNEKTPAADW